MNDDVLVVVEHLDGQVADTTFELLGQARQLADSSGGQVLAALLGAPDLAGELGAADRVLAVDHPALGAYTADTWERALNQLLAEAEPGVVLISTATVGIDLAGAVSAGWGAPLVSYVVDLQPAGDGLVATAQIYGGKLLAEVEVEADKVVCAVTAGAFPADAGRVDGEPEVDTVEPPVGLDSARVVNRGLTAPEGGDVDITAADGLVAVGRGVGSEDDLELVQDLAEAMGLPLAASRPVTDQGWLPKTRQVGKSGLTVKPRAYLMFGISGAPEHLEGMRDADLIIACNTDEQAPIFEVADYGTTLDLFDLVDALTEKLG